jgi:hypothetical protein
MASAKDCCVHGMDASDNGSPAREACTHGCDQGTCGNTTPHVNYLAGETHEVHNGGYDAHDGGYDAYDGGYDAYDGGYDAYDGGYDAYDGEDFTEEVPKPDPSEFDAAETEGVQRLTAEYQRLTQNEPSPTMSAAISQVAAAYVREYAPTHVQPVSRFDLQQLMYRIIRTWFHLKQEGNFLLGGRYYVSWTNDGNLRVEKISYKLRHEYTLCNDDALDIIMGELYSELPVLVPQLHTLLN